MISQPLVSAIIIFFNEGPFLEEAIASVFEQTYPHWELLLVNDGSTDRSCEIARQYAAQYPEKVRYLEHEGHENRGMSASRNLGIRNARGRYIAYLDGDDVWFANKLERQVALLQAHPEAVMVYGPLQRWYSWTGNPEDLHRDDLYGLYAQDICLKGDRLMEPPTLLALFLRYKSLIPAGILIEREVLEKVGGAEEVFRGNYEDAAVLVKVCLSHHVFVSSECWYRYRQHAHSCCRVTRQLGHSDATQLFFLTWVEQYLSQNRVKDLQVWRALQAALLPYRHPRWYRIQQGYQHLIGQIKKLVKFLGRQILPVPVRSWLRTQFTLS
jgi:glycosyltransferase involved in cell wall biosynthesis